MRQRILSGALLATLLAIAACEAAPSPSTTISPPAATPLATPVAATGPGGPAALDAVTTFDGSPESFGRLHAVLDQPAGAVAALHPLASDDDGDRRFAAIYLLALVARSPADVEPLRTALDDPFEELRAVAAGGLAAAGVVDGLPALIGLLEADGDMPYSDPPLRISDYARATLARLTDQPVTTLWRPWWDANGPGLRWDGWRYVTAP